MKLQLFTDYLQWYDWAFDYTERSPSVPPDVVPFVRKAAPGNGLSKAKQFEVLGELVACVVPHGPANELAKSLHEERFIVIYTDEWLHAGNGKELVKVKDVAEDDTRLASLFIPPANEGYYESIKYLYVGEVLFDFKCRSQDWRTNVETTEVFLQRPPFIPREEWGFTELARKRAEYHPLYSIDFVTDPCDLKSYAVDLNHAPGMAGLGVQEYMSAIDVVRSLKKWIELFGG